MTQRPAVDLVPAALLAMVLFAAVAHGLLLAGLTLPSWLLGASVAGALAVVRLRLPAPPPAWLAVLIGVALLAPLVGAVATPPRSWDGFTAWELTARFLAEARGLDHPYFADAGVYAYARAYPLLQPLLLAQLTPWVGAGGARAIFACFYLGLLLSVAAGLAGTGVAARMRHCVVAALGLTPLLLGPAHGSIDSGFADLLVGFLLAAAAVGIVRDAPSWAGLAAFLLPLAKNEGAVHALVLVLACGLTGRWRAARWASVGAAVALALWLPLRSRLASPGAAPSVAPALLVGAGALVPFAVLAVAGLLRRARHAPWWLGGGALALGAAAAIAWPWVSGSDAGVALGRGLRFELSVADVAGIGGTLLAQLVFVRKFGLAFALGVAVVIMAATRRGALAEARPLLVLAGVGLLPLMALLLTRSPAMLPLFLDEGTPRYLSQWLGVTWLTTGLLMHRLGVDPWPLPWPRRPGGR
ncbi:MAG: hypothetical protein AAF628_05600 [Planctomycetota bacterium]